MNKEGGEREIEVIINDEFYFGNEKRKEEEKKNFNLTNEVKTLFKNTKSM